MSEGAFERAIRRASERRERVDAAIAEWHDMDAALWRAWRCPSLVCWLGWTWEEYKAFVETGKLPNRRRGLAL